MSGPGNCSTRLFPRGKIRLAFEAGKSGKRGTALALSPVPIPGKSATSAAGCIVAGGLFFEKGADEPANAGPGKGSEADFEDKEAHPGDEHRFFD